VADGKSADADSPLTFISAGKKDTIMNNLQKWEPFKDWDPFRELSEFQNRLGSFFGRAPMRREEEGGMLSQWSPAVDIIEDDKEFLVKAELPEVKKEDVHVTVENGVLSVHGERKFEKEEKKQRYHRVERSYGTFTRSFSLPDGTDASKVRAEFKDGLLQVHLPKTESAKPKNIEVKVQ
jgi:HSP20 family protein